MLHGSMSRHAQVLCVDVTISQLTIRTSGIEPGSTLCAVPPAHGNSMSGRMDKINRCSREERGYASACQLVQTQGLQRSNKQETLYRKRCCYPYLRQGFHVAQKVSAPPSTTAFALSFCRRRETSGAQSLALCPTVRAEAWTGHVSKGSHYQMCTVISDPKEGIIKFARPS